MRRLTTLALAFALTAVACGGGTEGETASSPEASPEGGDQLMAQVASYDVAVSEGERRIIVGVLTADNRLVVGGEVEMAFSYLGTRDAPRESPDPGPETTGTFLLLPGEDLEDAPDRPQAVQPSEAQGLYATRAGFERAGIWRVEVTADVEGMDAGPAVAHFEVAEETQVPAPGDEAPATETLTIDSDAPPVAIDSRAQGEDGEVPDPELHETTIADAIAEGRPLLAVFSTPVYCVSRFCGPITEMVENLAADHAEEMAFVHVEIWQDFQEKTMNDAAREWLEGSRPGLEPWTFLIDGSGEIVARWDNVATRGEIEPEIEALLGS